MRFFDIHKNKKEPIKVQSISIAISKKNTLAGNVRLELTTSGFGDLRSTN